MGSVAEGVVRHATLPVLLFRQGVEHDALRHIMVAVDDSLGSDLAVQTTRAWAEQAGAQGQVLHVTTDPFVPLEIISQNTTFERDLARTTARIIERAERDLEHLNRLPTLIFEAAQRGVPDVILETARDAGVDLLVLGTQGRGGVERLLLGSVAETVARHATMPVLLVRGALEAVPDKTYRTEFGAGNREAKEGSR
jgi:nucleotide-binding universal stress UspA family protein